LALAKAIRDNAQSISASNFAKSVYELTMLIPKGKVAAYKDIAIALHCKAYRAVGKALSVNPFSNVPCHRVVKSDGKIGGFKDGIAKKIKLLEEEGLMVKNHKICDFKNRRISWHELILLKKSRKKC